MHTNTDSKIKYNHSLKELIHSMLIPVLVVNEKGLVYELNDAAHQLLDLDEGLNRTNFPISFYKLTNISLDLKGTKIDENKIFEIGTGEDVKYISIKTNQINSFDVTFYVVSIHDKTNEYLLEQKLKATQTALFNKFENYEKIQKEIEQRKAIEINLMQKAKDLMRSNADLERFAYVVSHDLQSPLRTISSYITLLKKKYSDNLDDMGNELIDYCVDSTGNMRSLINDLLDYSRVGTKAKPFSSTDTNAVLTAVKMNLRSDINQYQASVICNNLPVIKCDSSQILQLFQNLIGNAIKFVPKERNAIIEISCDDLGDEWMFTVKDNGIGIAEEQKDKIFQLFHRMEETKNYEGTGIGLAICKRIVERHNGEIWLESKIGEGTNFYFTIKK